jgi:hypothetical protein
VRRIVAAGGVLFFAGVLLAAVYGLDYGRHWDEWRLLESATNSIEKGDPLPHRYHNPRSLTI